MITKNIFKILILSFILTALYFIYSYYYNNSPIIIINADLDPIKVKPQKLGNTNASPIDSIIYETLSPKKILTNKTKFLPEAERPININLHNSLNELDDLMNELSNETLFNQNIGITTNEILDTPLNNPENKTGLNIIKITNAANPLLKQQHYSDNNYKIQLASVKSEAEATEEAERIKKKFIKILKNADITTQKIQYDDGKFFYLILAGNYKTINHAKAICKKLSLQQQNCVLK